MRVTSTRGRAPAVPFAAALAQGLAPDGGLYVPDRRDLQTHVAPLPPDASLIDVATAVLGHFLCDEIAPALLQPLLADALNFPMPLVPVGDRLWVLELFHGPTFAFKDVGARVMARLMAHVHADGEPLTVLVATSGDTGGAVAQAFAGLDRTRVVVLFPEGQVSAVQEAQFTTLGGNVTAIAVRGSFDDCQRLVKQAFADADFVSRMHLTSANSINIGRLLPQMVYYVYAALAQAASSDTPPVVSVPSGNFGNLCAGLFAQAIGAPIASFVAATTVNDTVPRYLATGRYEPRPSVSTLANAMDVGDPSNIERIRWFFADDVAAMRAMMQPSVHTDADVRRAIQALWREHGYLADPHTAIAYLGARAAAPERPVIVLGTAHPAKFREVVEPIVGERIALPAALQEALARPRRVLTLAPELPALLGCLAGI